MKISVIIPVYNASKYLDRCLQSLILAQIPEVQSEIILVNDGSTDNSLIICKKYAVQYNYIKVFDQQNQGPSEARNLGIQKANGDWITFVDSDDYIDEKYYKTIAENLQSDIDILIFGYIKVVDQIKINYPFLSRNLDRTKIEELLMTSSNNMKLFWFPVTKVYKRSVIVNVLFNKEIKIGEDTIFNIEVFTKANSIKIIDNCLYNYVHNKDSLTQVKYKENLLENMIAHYEARKVIHDFSNMKTIMHQKDIAIYYIEHILFWLFNNLKGNPVPNKNIENLNEIRNSIIYKETLSNYSYNWKHPRKSLLIKLFELRMFKLLLRLI